MLWTEWYGENTDSNLIYACIIFIEKSVCGEICTPILSNGILNGCRFIAYVIQ